MVIAVQQKFVIFVRVSTRMQELYGWGQDAQLTTCQQHVRNVNGIVVRTIITQESGKRASRQRALKEAMAVCEAEGAVLLVGALDRISRDAPFLLALRDSETRFVIASDPGMNDLTIGIMALLADHERRMISERTRRGLAEAQARGVLVGGSNPKWKLSKAGIARRLPALRLAAKERKEAGDARRLEFATKTLDKVLPHVLVGKTYKEIAECLNAANVPTLSGKGQWHPAAVRTVLLTAAPDTVKVVEEHRRLKAKQAAIEAFQKGSRRA